MADSELEGLVGVIEQAMAAEEPAPEVKTPPAKEDDDAQEEDPGIEEVQGEIDGDGGTENPEDSEEASAKKPAAGLDPERAGMLRDLQGERGKRQALEDQVKELAAKLQGLEVAQTKPAAEAPVDPLAELGEDDDILTVAQAKKLFATVREQANTATRNAAVELAEVQTRQQLTAQTMGEGMDYDSVLKAGASNLTPGDILDIQRAGAKAPTLAYQRCLERTPELRDRYYQRQALKTLVKDKTAATRLLGALLGKGAAAKPTLPQADTLDEGEEAPPRSTLSGGAKAIMDAFFG
jgi:hypothetical protein